jgi:hypothetical protein
MLCYGNEGRVELMILMISDRERMKLKDRQEIKDVFFESNNRGGSEKVNEMELLNGMRTELYFHKPVFGIGIYQS